MPKYDVIVVGTGAVGSAALWELARRGSKVIGLDQFDPPHNFGSSHGQSRIIRQAYFEHPDYTPLLLDTYPLWKDLEALTNRQLYHEAGVLQIGPPSGEVVKGVLQSAQQHQLPIEQLSAREICQRWPALRVPEELVGVFESRAGYLRVENCVAALLQAAQQTNAEVIPATKVLSWRPGPPANLQTTAGEFAADRLIITAGAWAGELLAELHLGLEVLRKSMFWFPPVSGAQQALNQLPCFLYELPQGVFYGMPPIDARGVKIAEHSGGQVVADPNTVNREVDDHDARSVGNFIEQHVPQLSPQRTDHCVCMYTMSRDGHFIVDRHPQHPHVLFAAGLSGHGFKFAPVLGKALANMAIEGTTDLPIGFLAQR